MKTTLHLFLTGIFVLTASFSGQAQSCYQNPSLEGPSQPHVVPAPWVACYGSPDTQPGQWGITQAPSDGAAYVSFLQSGWSANGYTEGMTQLLVPCMVAGQTYTFNVDLAHSPVYTTADPNGCYSSLAVWGGATSCAQTELLWTSGAFTQTNWQTYTITFTPTSSWCYLSFCPYFINVCGSTGSDYINCMLDNITCVTLANGNVQGTSATCNNSCDGQAWATVTSGTPPYTYNWMPGNLTTDTISGLCGGSYTCTITDAVNNVIVDSITLTQPPAFTSQSQINNVTCFGQCNGSATANGTGGTGAYTYNWMPGNLTTQVITNLCAGTYTCTITDANGCTTTVQAIITEPPTAVSATISGNNISCFSSCNGSATVVASGGTPGYTYNWSPSGGTSATASSLCAGSYTCTITDLNGCTTTQSFTVTQPPQLTAAAGNITNVLCNGTTTGSAAVTASGGSGGFTYSWAPSGGTGSSATNLGAGTYTVTVTDANSCTTTQTFNITQPPLLQASAIDAVVCPNRPVSVGANPTGGVGPYTYSWSNGQTTQIAPVSPAPTQNTSLTVTITDANGCQTTTTATVVIGDIPDAIYTTNAPTGTMSLVNGTAELCLIDGSVNAVTWAWFTGNGTQQFSSNLQSPCFTVTDTGLYCTRLYILSQSGCSDSLDLCVDINFTSYIIPNVFTPNGDNNNDLFYITSTGIKALDIVIYDRWGVEVHRYNTVNGSWNGQTKNGKDAVDGVYYYVAKMLDYSETPIEVSGFVHLITGK